MQAFQFLQASLSDATGAGIGIDYQSRHRKLFAATHPMTTRYTAIVKQQGQWWTGWIAEVPAVTCQELSREALMKSLTFALREALEASRDSAVSAAGEGYEEIELFL